MSDDTIAQNDPLWYKDAVIYELHVRAFRDGNADGIGDFIGLTEKLDYLKELGITAIWLLPFFPSPLKDDGYDIADYYKIHPDYGTLKSFKKFLAEAHKRNIRVIAELVINHTSVEHAWFQAARRAKEGSPERDYYVWSKTPDKYRDARIIFKDFETSNWTYDSVADSYFWHRFYSHQPDLNFENTEVQNKVLEVLDYWFSMGIDGLRLDAIPYLFEQEGTMCENLPQTHAFLQKLRRYADDHFPGRVLLAEANQWPEDAVAYFGEGTECHMAFHFPLMPRLFMAVWMEDSFPIIDILKSTPAIPPSCQWAMFLRNHDELTLEMVTDQERDYMYRVYARDPRMKINLGIRKRLAPLLANNLRKIEMMNILLFSFPGTPVLYYGDEIGMGDNHFLGDRNGVRTPMQWDTGKNAGFSEANPQMLYLPTIIDPQYHYQMVNVENQLENPSSLLCWMKRVIAMRNRYKVFGRGDLVFVSTDNPKVLAFMRTWEAEQLLVVVNISRFMQLVTLDLTNYTGTVPEELFSRNRLPPITGKDYTLTLGPYDHFWLMLQRTEATAPVDVPELFRIKCETPCWHDFLKTPNRKKFEQQVLPGYLRAIRWFGSKSRIITSVSIIDEIRLDTTCSSLFCIISVHFKEGDDERYLLPLTFEPFHSDKEAGDVKKSALCILATPKNEGYIADASRSETFRSMLLQIVSGKRVLKGRVGTLRGLPGKKFRNLAGRDLPHQPSHPLQVEQSNSSIIYGDRIFCKLYRKLEEGSNPEIEMLQFITDKTVFRNIPLFAGAIEYEGKDPAPVTIALMQSYTQNVSDGWKYVLSAAGHFFRHIIGVGVIPGNSSFNSHQSLLSLTNRSIPALFRERSGGLFYDMISLLGERTAQMHLSLATAQDDARFNPEPFSPLYQRSLYQSLQSMVSRNLQLLKMQLVTIDETITKEATAVVNAESALLRYARAMLSIPFSSQKIRIHGDYHLGQVLFTGKDFTIIDFEGEPARPIGERKLKYSCFRDIAGMVRSLHYAAYASVFLDRSLTEKDTASIEPWIEKWFMCAAGTFLESYFKTADGAAFIPNTVDMRQSMLDIYLLEKAVYELGYELNNRPAWTIIPLKGITHLMQTNNLMTKN